MLLTKQDRNEACVDFVNRCNFINAESGTLFYRPPHHTEGNSHQRASSAVTAPMDLPHNPMVETVPSSLRCLIAKARSSCSRHPRVTYLPSDCPEPYSDVSAAHRYSLPLSLKVPATPPGRSAVVYRSLPDTVDKLVPQTSDVHSQQARQKAVNRIAGSLR
ncbi:MAG: hypothetical protein FRX49_01605 [Trebouxia sp. A1-2]|nr:MAG: hypothetical protein FRX49_01605 [Trebouxia sp. A1-2]